jgi:hypothetical protein
MLSYLGEVSLVLPLPAWSGDFLDASMVLEFDLKPWGVEVKLWTWVRPMG